MQQSEYGPRAELHGVSFLHEHFDLGTIRVVKDLGGTYNLNLLLQTERGQYVLRYYRPWISRQRLSQLQQVKRLLANSSLPVPLPLRTKTGATILSYRERLLEIEPFVAHNSEADTWERMEIAFSLLGKLHTHLARIEADIHLVAPIVSNYATPEELFTWIQQAEEKSASEAQPLTPEQQRLARSIYTDTRKLLVPIQQQWHTIQGQLPHQLTHGDYGGGNVLFQNQQPVAILDFDFLGHRERLFEIAYTLYWWLHKQSPDGIRDIGPWQKVKSLLASYNTTAAMPLTHLELQVLPLEMARVPLYWIGETYFLPSPAQAVLEHVNKVVDARWIVEQSEQMINLFAQD